MYFNIQISWNTRLILSNCAHLIDDSGKSKAIAGYLKLSHIPNMSQFKHFDISYLAY